MNKRSLDALAGCCVLLAGGACGVLDAPHRLRSGSPQEASSSGARTDVQHIYSPSADNEPAAGEANAHVSSFAPLARGELWAHWNALRGDSYELDVVPRRIEEGEAPPCDPKSLVVYRGEVLRYYGALTVSEHFKERLTRFENVVADVARDVYGRTPDRIRHYGAYSCRTTRNRSWRVSEHALGNALDVVGFDFKRASKEEPLPEGLPQPLRHAFQVRVARHWSASKGVGAVHARFLAQLTQRLSERDDIFRSMFGPGHGGHHDHLHLDVSPWRYVDL